MTGPSWPRSFLMLRSAIDTTWMSPSLRRSATHATCHITNSAPAAMADPLTLNATQRTGVPNRASNASYLPCNGLSSGWAANASCLGVEERDGHVHRAGDDAGVLQSISAVLCECDAVQASAATHVTGSWWWSAFTASSSP